MSDSLLIIKHQIKPFFLGIICYDIHAILVGCIEYDKWDNYWIQGVQSKMIFKFVYYWIPIYD